MGPRNRRRLAIGGSVVAVIAAVAAAVLLTRSSSPPRRAARSSTSSAAALTAKFKVPEREASQIVFGMSGKQVRHLLGPSAATRGRCWLYQTTVDPRLVARGVVETDLEVCFFVGRVSDTSYTDYVRFRGKLVAVPKPKPRIG